MIVASHELLIVTAVLVCALALTLDAAAAWLVPRVVAIIRGRILSARAPESRQRYGDAVLTPAVSQIVSFLLLQLSLVLLDAGFRAYITISHVASINTHEFGSQDSVNNTGGSNDVPGARMFLATGALLAAFFQRLPAFLLVQTHYWTAALWFYGVRVGLFMYRWGAIGQFLAFAGFMTATATTYAYSGAAADFDPLVVAAMSVLRRPLQSLIIGCEIVCLPLVIDAIFGVPKAAIRVGGGYHFDLGRVIHRVMLLAMNVVLVLMAAKHGHTLSVDVSADVDVFRQRANTACEGDADVCPATATDAGTGSSSIFFILHLMMFAVYMLVVWSRYNDALQIMNSKATLLSHDWAPTFDPSRIAWRGPTGWHHLRESLANAAQTIATSLWWPLRNLRAADVQLANGMLSDSLLRILQAFSAIASVAQTAHSVLATRSIAWSARMNVPVNESDKSILNLRGLSLRVTSYSRRAMCGCRTPRFCWRRQPLFSLNFANETIRAAEGAVRPGWVATDFATVPITLTGRVYTAALCRQLRRLELMLHAPPSLQPATAWRSFLMQRHHKTAAALSMFPNDARGALPIDAQGFVRAPSLQPSAVPRASPSEADLIEDVPDDSSVAAEDDGRDVWETDPNDVLYPDYALSRGAEREAVIATQAALAAAGPHVNLAVGGGWLLPRMSAMLRSVLSGEPIVLPGETAVRWWNLTAYDMGRAVMWAARDDAAQATRSVAEATVLMVEGMLGPLAAPLAAATATQGMLVQGSEALRRFGRATIGRAFPRLFAPAEADIPVSLLDHMSSWLRASRSRAPGLHMNDESMVECELILRHGAAVLRVPLVGCSSDGWHGLLLEQGVMREMLSSVVQGMDEAREGIAHSMLEAVAGSMQSRIATEHDQLPHAMVRHMLRTFRKCSAVELRTATRELSDPSSAYNDAFCVSAALHRADPSSPAPDVAAAEFVAWLQAVSSGTGDADTSGDGLAAAALQQYDLWERAVQELVGIFKVEGALSTPAATQPDVDEVDTATKADTAGSSAAADPVRDDSAVTPASAAASTSVSGRFFSTFERLNELWSTMMTASHHAADAVSEWHIRHTLWRWLTFDLLQRMALSYSIETSRRRLEARRHRGRTESRASSHDFDAPIELPELRLRTSNSNTGIEGASTQKSASGTGSTTCPPTPVEAAPNSASAPTQTRARPDLTGAELVVHVANLLLAAAASPVAKWR